MLRRVTWILAVAAMLVGVAPAFACPNCKEAASSAIDDSDDPYREGRAFNYSIYMMLAVPYSIVGFGGFYLYRHLRSQPTQFPPA